MSSPSDWISAPLVLLLILISNLPLLIAEFAWRLPVSWLLLGFLAFSISGSIAVAFSYRVGKTRSSYLRPAAIVGLLGSGLASMLHWLSVSAIFFGGLDLRAAQIIPPLIITVITFTTASIIAAWAGSKSSRP